MPYSIREEKRSATKLSILQSLIQRIESQALEDISIKDICKGANIAVATFFLYFPQKTSILDYFIQLWSVEISWRISGKLESLPPIAIIEDVFDYTGLRATQKPELFAEVISYLSKKREGKSLPPPSPLELQFAFPDCAGIESVEPKSLWAIFSQLLELAMEKGDIPKATDLQTAVFTLISIFFSVPVLAKTSSSADVRQMYRKQLDLLWAGLADPGKRNG